MSDHINNLESPGRRRSGRCDWRVLAAIVVVSLVVTTGCGSDQSALFPQASVDIIRGKDSAGATIEVEKRGNDLTVARVIDTVLGAGEGEIISRDDGDFEFTVHFPAGATITYVGLRDDDGAPEKVQLSGTWQQQPSGVFGADRGVWGAPSPPNAAP